MSGLMPDYRIIGSSTSDLTDEEFRHLARHACDQFATSKVSLLQWANFEKRLSFVSTSAGPEALADGTWRRSEAEMGGDVRRLHYLSIPPPADRAVIQLLADAKLVERSRVVMEKPFGTDLASAVALNDTAAPSLRRGADLPHRPLPRQGGGAEHFGLPLRQRPLRAHLEP